jgi:hypothetical protein
MRVSPLPETLADAGSRIAAASGIDAKRGWESSLLAANLNQADFPDDPVAKSTDPHQNVFFLICAGARALALLWQIIAIDGRNWIPESDFQ